MNVNNYLAKYNKGNKECLSLEAINFLMEKFNHPENSLKFIHIAGTNGKGSCTEMMSNILVKAGYRVGKFLSPHLIRYNERISINQELISDKDMEELINEIEKCKSINNIELTLFELETAMAIIYFARNDCDFVVLEVGLGGKYDSTNIVNPLVSIINSIGYDHMHLLGNTLEEIAKNKAGIIKENSATVFIKQQECVNDVIINTCNEKNNELHLIDVDEIKNYTFDKDYQKIDYKKYKDILINLKGEKQIYNAVLCLEAVDIINKKYYVSEEAVKVGLKSVVHKARFEKISDNPLIIFDGAHNTPAIENLRKTISMYYTDDIQKVFIVSILNTKDYKQMLKSLMIDNDSIYFFTSGNDENRYTKKEVLYEEAQKIGKYKEIYQYDLNSALDIIFEKEIDAVNFFVGSFYVYGDVISKNTSNS